MLKRLNFENYKAFDKGSIEIRPITILLGANSVGKSSILQLFLLLQQTSEADRNYKSALKLNGGFVSLGEGLNLLRNKDATKPLVLSLDFKDSEIFSNLSHNFLSTYCWQIMIQANYLSKISGKQRPVLGNILKGLGLSSKVDLDYQYDMLLYGREKDEKIIDRKAFEELIDFIYREYDKNDKTKNRLSDESRYIFHIRNLAFGGISNIKNSKDEFLIAYDFLSGLSKINLSQDLNITYSLKTTDDNTIRIKKVVTTQVVVC
jgi:hypothetical protein